jgi:hypothetical protein
MTLLSQILKSITGASGNQGTGGKSGGSPLSGGGAGGGSGSGSGNGAKTAGGKPTTGGTGATPQALENAGYSVDDQGNVDFGNGHTGHLNDDGSVSVDGTTQQINSDGTIYNNADGTTFDPTTGDIYDSNNNLVGSFDSTTGETTPEPGYLFNEQGELLGGDNGDGTYTDDLGYTYDIATGNETTDTPTDTTAQNSDPLPSDVYDNGDGSYTSADGSTVYDVMGNDITQQYDEGTWTEGDTISGLRGLELDRCLG